MVRALSRYSANEILVNRKDCPRMYDDKVLPKKLTVKCLIKWNKGSAMIESGPTYNLERILYNFIKKNLTC